MSPTGWEARRVSATEHPLDPTTTQAWVRLASLAEPIRAGSLRDNTGEHREGLRVDASSWHLDLSRQLVTPEILDTLLELARDTGVEEQRSAMRAGQRINTTEDRAVLHMALRGREGESWEESGVDVGGAVRRELDHMADISTRIRDGRWRGSTNVPIRNVVNIGIGGSDLGPAMAYHALTDFRDPGIQCSFVSNVDPTDIYDALRTCQPESTLFIVSSKTFTTHETMTNAAVARDWVVEALGEASVGHHFIAVSTNTAAAEAFGIPHESIVGFWDWVGGRFSVDSAIGLSLMVAIGPDNFDDLLAGFHDMDAHFLTAPGRSNLPILMAMCGIWNRDFLGIETVAVLPYSHRLARFPAYLQQLVMESNGKSVRRDGSPVTYPTSAIYWGEPGTNGQHSFHQLLHQGTSEVACEFIVIANAGDGVQDQQDILVANALAQASVLTRGRTATELRHAGTDDTLVPHKVMVGGRPVTLLMTAQLTPRSLGSLIALYEHVVFVQGAVWGINSFDQWGVELGKTVAVGIEEDIRTGCWDDPDLDEPTRESIRLFLRLRDRN